MPRGVPATCSSRALRLPPALGRATRPVRRTGAAAPQLAVVARRVAEERSPGRPAPRGAPPRRPGRRDVLRVGGIGAVARPARRAPARTQTVGGRTPAGPAP